MKFFLKKILAVILTAVLAAAIFTAGIRTGPAVAAEAETEVQELTPAGRNKLNDRLLEEIVRRTKEAAKAGHPKVDFRDLNIGVTLTSSDYDPDYYRVTRALEQAVDEVLYIKMGSNIRKVAYSYPDTEDQGGVDAYGCGEYLLSGATIEFNGMYRDLMSINYEEGYKDFDPKILEDASEKISQSYDIALSQVKEGMSDIEKALVLYDYLMELNNYPDLWYTEWCDSDDGGYSTDVFESKYHSPENIFLEQKGVCSAYGEAYAMLLCDAGIEAMSISSAEINHEWTMIKLDGVWYHCDPTWDDPRYEWGYTANGDYNDDHWDMSYMKHDYFLLSEDEILTDHPGQRYWQEAPMLTEINYEESVPAAAAEPGYQNYFFRGGADWGNDHKLNYIDGYWYVQDYYNGIYKLKCEPDAEPQAKYVLPGDERILRLTGDQKQLYAMTDKNIYTFDPETGSFTKL
ncbi:MAG: hypothetical protein IJL97_04515, partial [Lachnospiraceae bacterium]|nr:hypothetical protein [Lachnospiraceae bacterium]